MSQFKTAGLGTYTLAGSITSTQTSITLSSFKVPVTETNVTMASMGTDIAYGTLSPGTVNAEFISFTGITQNANGTATLTGVTRGLDKQSPYTTVAGFKRPHTGQAIFILSNSPNVYDQFPAKQNNETITGKWTFPNDANTPVIGASYAAPTTDTQVATKKYVDDTAIAGSPDANTTTKGIVQIATQAQVDARTATGSTSAFLVATPALNRNVLTHDYVASSAGTDAYAITLTPAVTAYTTGDVYYFKADVANTGACSLNVNALGAKSLKIGGQDPITGTIAANSIVQVQYDGTNMNILAVSDWITLTATAGKIVQRNSTGDVTVPTTPTATTDAASKSYVDNLSISFKSGITTKVGTDASTTQTIAHGLGKTPKYVKITAMATNINTNNQGSTFLYAFTTYNGTTQSSMSLHQTSSSLAACTIETTFMLSPNGSSPSSSDYQTGVLTWDATNINIAWTKTGGGSNSTFTLLWEAQG